jgi:quinol-cytochrome oxidoreductase complex cytochrome b subunit
VEIGNLLGAFGFWFSPTMSASLPIVGRLYIAHVVILPALGTFLLIAHFLLVKRHGISAQPADFDAAVDGAPEPSKSGSTFAVHLIRMVGFGLVILAVTSLLSLVVRTPLGASPNPSVEVSKPWWMFLPFYPFEDWFGLPALIWAPGLLIGVLALVPFVDRSRYRSPARRRAFIIAGAIVLIALVALVAYALIEPAKSHVEM